VAITAAAGVDLLFRVADLDFDGLSTPPIPGRGGSLDVPAVPPAVQVGEGRASWRGFADEAGRDADTGAEAGSDEKGDASALLAQADSDASLLGLGGETAEVAAPEQTPPAGGSGGSNSSPPSPSSGEPRDDDPPPAEPTVEAPLPVEPLPVEPRPVEPRPEPDRDLEGEQPPVEEPPPAEEPHHGDEPRPDEPHHHNNEPNHSEPPPEEPGSVHH
jgi:hypothetical protein